MPRASTRRRAALTLALAWGLRLAAPCPAGEPPWTPADAEALRLVEQEGPGALDPVGRARVRFWTWYHRHRARAEKVHDGALLADDFDGPVLDLEDGETTAATGHPGRGGRWRLWQSDEQIEIGQDGGRLAIRGRSSRSAGHNFNGIVGPVHGDTDVVVVARVRSGAPDAEQPGTHVAMVHLCGTTPDHFHELGFGRAKNGLVGWTHHQVSGPFPGDRTIGGIDAFGDESGRFHTVKLEHDAATESSRAWVRHARRWHEVGEPRSVVLSTAKVELKVDVPIEGVEVESAFDDCRMYGRPETHPVEILCTPSIIGETSPAGVEVDLWLDGDQPAARGVTDHLGRVSLGLPSDRVYPIAARVGLTLTDGTAWSFPIAHGGVEGLYPGDVWVVRLNALDMAGHDYWWKVVRTRWLERARAATDPRDDGG